MEKFYPMKKEEKNIGRIEEIDEKTRRIIP